MKVLLVDDHPLILSALQAVIQGLGDDVQVTGVGSAAAARATMAAASDFEMMLLDLSLGDADGFELLAEMRAAYPAVPVVVVSASERASDVIRAIDLGAMGFVPKRSSNAALFGALRMVMSGGLYVPPTMLGLDYSRLSSGMLGDEPLLGPGVAPEPHQQVSSIEKIASPHARPKCWACC